MATIQAATIPSQPTLRVMRLYKPSMQQQSTIPHVDNVLQTFSLSNFLLLPDSFGDLYVGETFRAYVAVINTLEQRLLSKATLSIRIQASDAAPVDLFNSAEMELLPDDKISNVIAHRITEIGNHTLRVVLQYEDHEISATDRITIKKQYRFNVLTPIGVSATVYAPSKLPNGWTFPVQLQLTNNTTQGMCIVSAEVVPASERVRVTSVAVPVVKEAYSPLRVLLPEETHAFGFLLSLPDEEGADPAQSLSLGWPRVHWANVFGEGGVFRGVDLVHSPAGPLGKDPECPISAECVFCPKRVVVGEVFDVVFRFSSVNEVPAGKYELRRGGMGMLIALGSATVSLQNIASGMPVEVTVSLCATALGTFEASFLLIDVASDTAFTLRGLTIIVTCIGGEHEQ